MRQLLSIHLIAFAFVRGQQDPRYPPCAHVVLEPLKLNLVLK